jgi:hypothetical protein
MALLTRIYFNGVFGALGGLLGWMFFGVFDDMNKGLAHALLAVLVRDSHSAQHLQLMTDWSDRLGFILSGALIGAAIGSLVVSVEAIRDRSAIRFFRLAAYGLILGAIGGAIGMPIGDEINYVLVKLLGYHRDSGMAKYVLHVFGTMLARGLGWTVLGLTIGGCEGIAARSLGKFSYGTIGGLLGGGIGGAIFGLAYQLIEGQTGGKAAFFGALGFVILGASIGSLSALVQGVFQPASVKVMRGWQEGREYPLDKADSLVGRDEHADIALFRDMRVEKRHIVIHRVGKRFILENNGAPPEFTRVNDQPVAGERELEDGDRIQLGNVVLRFQMRAAAPRKGPRPSRYPDVPRDAKVLPSDGAGKQGIYADAQRNRFRRP